MRYHKVLVCLVGELESVGPNLNVYLSNGKTLHCFTYSCSKKVFTYYYTVSRCMDAVMMKLGCLDVSAACQWLLYVSSWLIRYTDEYWPSNNNLICAGACEHSVRFTGPTEAKSHNGYVYIQCSCPVREVWGLSPTQEDFLLVTKLCTQGLKSVAVAVWTSILTHLGI